LRALYYSALVYAIVITIGTIVGLDKQDLADFYKGDRSIGEDIVALL
jgi:hypothetical protein